MAKHYDKRFFHVSFGYIYKKHTQTFGNGLVAALDTNSNRQPLNDLGGLQVIDDAASHSISRNSVSTITGIGFEAEYRSYIKTYTTPSEMLQEVGTLPRSLDSKLLPQILKAPTLLKRLIGHEQTNVWRY